MLHNLNVWKSFAEGLIKFERLTEIKMKKRLILQKMF